MTHPPSDPARFPIAAFIALTAAFMAAACVGIGLAFDGSFVWFHAVERGQPFIPHNRLINVLLQTGPVLASRYVRDPRIVSAIFSLPYLLVPLISLLLSWRIVRRRAPGLMLWTVGWVLLAPLPGQVDIVSEANLIVQLMWPVFLIGLLGVRWRDLPVVAVLAGLASVSHPTSSAILGLAAATFVISAALNPVHRTLSLITSAALFATTAADLWSSAANLTSYEVSVLNRFTQFNHFDSGMAGEPLIFLIMTGIAFGWIIWSMLRKQPTPQMRTILTLMFIGGACLCLRAALPFRWKGAVTYHYYTLLVALPFLIAAAIDVWQTSRQPDASLAVTPLRYRMVQASLLIAAAVMLTHAISWQVYAMRLRASMAASPEVCLSVESPELEWAGDTVAGYWSATTLGFWIQSHEPRKLIVFEPPCAAHSFDGGFQLDPWENYAWGERWFDLRPLGASLQSP